jgi:hypothetical protein
VGTFLSSPTSTLYTDRADATPPTGAATEWPAASANGVRDALYDVRSRLIGSVVSTREAASIYGNGTNDDRLALQNFLTANAGKSVFLPDNYLIRGSPLTVPAGTRVIMPNGPAPRMTDWSATPRTATALGSWIIRDDASMAAFVMGYNTSLEGVAIKHSGATAVTSGAAVLVQGAHFVSLRDLTIFKAYDGVKVGGSAASTSWVLLDNLDIHDSIHSGITVDGNASMTNDVTIYRTAIVQEPGDSTCDCLVVTGHIEALVAHYLSTWGGRYGLDASGTLANGNAMAGSRFHACYFDTNSLGVRLTGIRGTTFQGGWFVYALAGNAVTVAGCEDVLFQGSEIHLGRTHGIQLQTGCRGVRIQGCSLQRSTHGNGGGDAVRVDAGVSDFAITGNYISNTMTWGIWPAGYQQYGVNVAAGASDRYVIADNIGGGGLAGVVSDNGSGVNKRVANNY